MEPSNLQAVTRWGKVHAWWLMHPGVQADHFCVLAALATYADEDGFCEPSQQTLARWLHRSRPWVNRVIAELETLGILLKTARTRKNGGTTSCRYRLSANPPEAADQAGAALPTERPVRPRTPPVTAPDTPRQPADMTYLDSEHNQSPAPDGRAHRVSQTATDILPVDWQPSEAAVARAVALYPGGDLTEHVALFVARCRGKGYAVDPRNADDVWLSWLIEDSLKAARQPSRDDRRKPVTDVGKAAGSPSRRSQEVRFDRFAAWGLSASTGNTVDSQRF